MSGLEPLFAELDKFFLSGVEGIGLGAHKAHIQGIGKSGDGQGDAIR